MYRCLHTRVGSDRGNPQSTIKYREYISCGRKGSNRFGSVLQIVNELKLDKPGPILGTLMTKAKEWQYANALQHASAPDGPPEQLVAYLRVELSKLKP